MYLQWAAKQGRTMPAKIYSKKGPALLKTALKFRCKVDQKRNCCFEAIRRHFHSCKRIWHCTFCKYVAIVKITRSRLICEWTLVTPDKHVNFSSYKMYEITHLVILCATNPDLIEQIQLVEMTSDRSTEDFLACTSRQIKPVLPFALFHMNQI